MTVSRVAVVGAGTMGRGIAYVAALAKLHVDLIEVQPPVLAAGLDAIANMFDEGVRRGKLAAQDRGAILGRVHGTDNLADGVRQADLLIEAVPENLELKRAVFRSVDEYSPSHAILATNTSSLSVGSIAEATRRPERVVGMHFFNPPHVLKLLEVVRGPRTDDVTIAGAVEVARRMGKEPILVKDSPGFASSRLGVALGLEAIRMLEAGVASAEDIDKAMELGYNHPMGPLKLTDLVGLDVRLAIAKHLHQAFGSETFRPPRLLESMVAQGKLGRKTGEGFYRY